MLTKPLRTASLATSRRRFAGATAIFIVVAVIVGCSCSRQPESSEKAHAAVEADQASTESPAENDKPTKDVRANDGQVQSEEPVEESATGSPVNNAEEPEVTPASRRNPTEDSAGAPKTSEQTAAGDPVAGTSRPNPAKSNSKGGPSSGGGLGRGGNQGGGTPGNASKAEIDSANRQAAQSLKRAEAAVTGGRPAKGFEEALAGWKKVQSYGADSAESLRLAESLMAVMKKAGEATNKAAPDRSSDPDRKTIEFR